MKDKLGDPVVANQVDMARLGCTSEIREHMYILVHVQCLIHLIVFIRIMNALFGIVLVEYVVILCLAYAATQLIDELDAQHLVLDVLVVVYPQCKRGAWNLLGNTSIS
jgi:hypothetical protein